jgi:predicted dithiol-disulfide oxidoreductase (DUF899 family)
VSGGWSLWRLKNVSEDGRSAATRSGTDLLAGTYNYLDLTPLGRQEDWEEPSDRSTSPFLAWVRHHDKYADVSKGSEGCCSSEA